MKIVLDVFFEIFFSYYGNYIDLFIYVLMIMVNIFSIEMIENIIIS